MSRQEIITQRLRMARALMRLEVLDESHVYSVLGVHGRIQDDLRGRRTV